MSEPLYEKARRIAAALSQAKQVLMVGGCVRDRLLNLPVKDIDLEVFGLNYEQIASALQRAGFHTNMVGQQFAVIKVDNTIDVSIPRRESKLGIGHKGFAVTADPNMDFAEAAARRDFTINAMAEDFAGNLYDPYNGRADLAAKCLRAVSPAFVEDPLRVLRGMQLAARFNLQLDPDTARLCRSLTSEFHTLAAERLWVEWEKWATKGDYPGAGLRLLLQTHWIQFFPELAALVDLPQDPEWHPEGDVFIHTLHVCDAAAAIARRENLNDPARAVLLFAALCHDLGKALTTQRNDAGRWVAPNHAKLGTLPSETFLRCIHAPRHLIEHVLPLVAEHMAHISHQDEPPTPRIVRRLANRLHPASLRMLAMLTEADHSGRPPLPTGQPMQVWLDVAHAMQLADQKPKPILMGRHLLQRGFTPGSHFKQ